eukprot:scaffold1541_cov418-Prasinococcus_capsulatus_cf.AAC.15
MASPWMTVVCCTRFAEMRHAPLVRGSVAIASNVDAPGDSCGAGELRLLEDPRNRSFLESINNGECPRELAPENRMTPVHVNLVRKVRINDRRLVKCNALEPSATVVIWQDEDWKPPPKEKYKAFSGTGRSLKDEAGEGSAAAPQATGEVPQGDFVYVHTCMRSAYGTFLIGHAVAIHALLRSCDESRPTTRLQIRLHDGQRLYVSCPLPGGTRALPRNDLNVT